MKRKMRVAQVFVDNDEFRAAIGLPADAKILSVDGLNVPLGFFTILVESKRLPLDEIVPNVGTRTVELASLQNDPVWKEFWDLASGSIPLTRSKPRKGKKS